MNPFVAVLFVTQVFAYVIGAAAYHKLAKETWHREPSPNAYACAQISGEPQKQTAIQLETYMSSTSGMLVMNIFSGGTAWRCEPAQITNPPPQGFIFKVPEK